MNAIFLANNLLATVFQRSWHAGRVGRQTRYACRLLCCAPPFACAFAFPSLRLALGLGLANPNPKPHPHPTPNPHPTLTLTLTLSLTLTLTLTLPRAGRRWGRTL